MKFNYYYTGVLLIVLWLIGFLAFNYNGYYHTLLIVAAITIIIGINKSSK